MTSASTKMQDAMVAMTAAAASCAVVEAADAAGEQQASAWRCSGAFEGCPFVGRRASECPEFEFDYWSSWFFSREDAVNVQREASSIRDAQAHAPRWAMSSAQELRRCHKCSRSVMNSFCALSVSNFFSLIILLNLRFIHSFIHSLIHPCIHPFIDTSIHPSIHPFISISLVVCALFWRVPLYVSAMHPMNALALWAISCIWLK